jgi:S1-C subfamily serine protease
MLLFAHGKQALEIRSSRAAMLRPTSERAVHIVSFHTPAERNHPTTRSYFFAVHAGITFFAFLLAIGCARMQPGPATSDTETKPPTRQALIERIVDASVKVAVERGDRHVMSASGIVIASQPASQNQEAVSYVLTAAHGLVGSAGAKIFVGFCGPHAARGKLPATVISQGKPETLDVALLRVTGIAVAPVVVPDDDRVSLGKQIFVVGFPEGQRLGISGGIISQIPLSELENGIPADRVEERIVIDAAAPRGVSGGGVFDAETGRFVGIVQGHHTFSIPVKDQAQTYTLKFPVPGATFVVPMAQIRPFLMTPAVADALPRFPPTTARTSTTISR